MFERPAGTPWGARAPKRLEREGDRLPPLRPTYTKLKQLRVNTPMFEIASVGHPLHPSRHHDHHHEHHASFLSFLRQGWTGDDGSPNCSRTGSAKLCTSNAHPYTHGQYQLAAGRTKHEGRLAVAQGGAGLRRSWRRRSQQGGRKLQGTVEQ